MTAIRLAAALLAAQPAPGPGLLTFGDAVREAQARNLDLQAARARLDQARTLGWKAWSYHLPQIVASGTDTRNSAAVPIDLRPIVPQPIVFQPLIALSGQAQVTQALIAPSLWFGIAAAQAGEKAAEQGTEAARREILFGVAQLYFGAVGGKFGVQITERQLAVALDHEKDARVRFQAGSAPKVALLRAEIDRAKAEQDLKSAQAGYDSARSALATLLDRAEPGFDVETPPELLPPPGVAELEEGAARDRPDVQAAETAVKAAERGRGAVWGRYLPNLGAFGRYLWQDPVGLTGKHESWAVGLALNWTLLDGTLREAELAENGAKVAEAEANLRNARLKARDEVRRARLELDAALANREKARETVELARENQRLVDVNFRAGAATALEASDANAQLTNAELANVTERLKAQLAVLKLLKAAGRFDPR
jgi:outer membrane protein TolC